MHLRHLIVLIIDARNAGLRLVIATHCHRTRTKFATLSQRGLVDRSDQINQNSRAVTVPPRGTGQTGSKASLNDVERSGSASSEDDELPNLLSVCDVVLISSAGGARRDRTDDLMLAKHALSQLSYGPNLQRGKWWARVDSNYRPHAYQACALTT